MKTFISGATGYLGQRLTMKLAEGGEEIHILVRNKAKSPQLVHPNISIFVGDILDSDSIKVAMEGCEKVFHVAALARAWSKNHYSYLKKRIG
ncbi:NAD(P)H-binding protein [Fontibacter flavus]|uniref:NAD(P)H-binding protein n=1 Tax=Fontibacter flavus TaxID=654838 RepID=A0ABV6FRB5_9BACT